MGYLILALTVLFVWDIFLTTNLIAIRNESEDYQTNADADFKTIQSDFNNKMSICSSQSKEALRTSKNVANFVWGRQTEPNVIENDQLGGL